MMLSPPGHPQRPGSSRAPWVRTPSVAQAERLRTIGARVIDAPVTGGVAGAAAGRLMLFVSGADEDIAAAQPVLRALGTPEVVGAGSAMAS